MTRRVLAIVDGPILLWARETAGLDLPTAAKRLAVTETRLRAWEAGEARPYMGQLRKMADVYRRPLAAFYLAEPPPIPRRPRDFRRLPGVVSGLESPNLISEWRRAMYRRELALEWLEDDGEVLAPLRLTAELGEDPEALGHQIRNFLSLPIVTQFAWRSPYDALNGWRSAIEAVGVLVMQMTDVASDEVRGFSIADEPLPVACVNIKDAPNGRTFTLLHEFAHLLLRQGGLCDLDDNLTRPPELLEVERYANQVAAATLMPRSALRVDPTLVQHTAGQDWTDFEIEQISRRFSVSNEAIVRRLLELGIVSRRFYQQKRQQYHDAYEESLRNRPPGFAPPAQVALACVGPTFAGLTINNYDIGRITAGDVSDALGVRTKHIPQIARMVAQRIS